MHEAYRQDGYRLAGIARHPGVPFATVSRRLKQAEEEDVRLQDQTTNFGTVRCVGLWCGDTG